MTANPGDRQGWWTVFAVGPGSHPVSLVGTGETSYEKDVASQSLPLGKEPC